MARLTKNAFRLEVPTTTSMMNLFVILAFCLLGPSLLTSSAQQFEKRQAQSSKSFRWYKGIVPFRYVSKFTDEEKLLILQAMAEWEKYTCIRFLKVDGKRIKSTVDIQRNSSACYSLLGSRQILRIIEPKKHESTRQPVNLGLTCMKVGIIAHELGHTLGLYHEHVRLDRDKFVKIVEKNIKPEFISQFKKPESQKTFGLPYSYRSIMHYGKSYFSNGKGNTMIARDPRFVDVIGHATHLAFRDVEIMNKMYSCNAKCKQQDACPFGGFRGPNCRCWCPNPDFTAVDCETKKAIDKNRPKHKTGRILRFSTGGVYFWSGESANWFQAKRQCEKLGGSLINFNTSATHKRVLAMHKKLSASGLKFKFLWTGGNDIEKEGVFKWTNKQAVNVDDLSFARGEPNNGDGSNEDCIAMAVVGYLNRFADIDCGYQSQFICELPNRNCYDGSTTCDYFKTIGQCDEEKTKLLCKRTCSLCTESDTTAAPSTASTTPKPSEEASTPSPVTTTTSEPVVTTTSAAPEVSTTTTTTTTTTAPTAPTTPTAEPEASCNSLSCFGTLRRRFFYRTRVGSKLCISCPECECRIGRLNGFRTYTHSSTACCAMKQMKGSSKGEHLVTREGYQPEFFGGMKNGIISRRHRGSRFAFSIEVEEEGEGEEGTEEVETEEKPETGACIPMGCAETLESNAWFMMHSPGQSMCVRCSDCSCDGETLLGFKRYTHNSSPCCAIKQVQGSSLGKHFIRMVGEAWTLPGGTANGITSYPYFGIFPYPYVFEVEATKEAEVDNPSQCVGEQFKVDCGEKMEDLPRWSQMPFQGEICIQCPACSCTGDNAQRVNGDEVYHQSSDICCSAAHQKGKSKGIHAIRKVHGAIIYKSAIRHGIQSTGGVSLSKWAFKVLRA